MGEGDVLAAGCTCIQAGMPRHVHLIASTWMPHQRGVALTDVEGRACLCVHLQLLPRAHRWRQVVGAGQHVCVRKALEEGLRIS